MRSGPTTMWLIGSAALSRSLLYRISDAGFFFKDLDPPSAVGQPSNQPRDSQPFIHGAPGPSPWTATWSGILRKDFIQSCWGESGGSFRTDRFRFFSLLCSLCFVALILGCARVPKEKTSMHRKRTGNRKDVRRVRMVGFWYCKAYRSLCVPGCHCANSKKMIRGPAEGISWLRTFMRRRGFRHCGQTTHHPKQGL